LNFTGPNKETLNKWAADALLYGIPPAIIASAILG